ncbi:MAG: DNA polymerase III subunit delta [Candidatus Komeilibacteria bacterium]
MIFFFYGDDTYRSYAKIKQIRDKFRQEVDPSGFNILLLDGAEIKLEDFNAAVSQAGFLANKRLIIIKNIFNNKSLNNWRDEIIAYLNRQTDSPEENYLLWWQAGIPDKRNALFKKLSSYKFSQQFDPLTDNKLLQWIMHTCQEQNVQITKPAAHELVAIVGNNLWQLSQEIAKLANYKPNQLITPADIELLAHGQTNENIFILSDAVAQQNRAKALKLLNNQINAGLNEQYLLTMIIRQFRILIQLKSLLNSGIAPNKLASAAALHPFVVKKAQAQIQKYNLQQLTDIYHRLLKTDLELKSTNINSKILLNKLIIKTSPPSE